MFYFEQVFVFGRLINKNMLKWFLLIICKQHILERPTSLFSRNHPTLYFWLRREVRQIPNTEQLLYQTCRKSHWRCSIKKLFLKFHNNHWKTPVLDSLSQSCRSSGLYLNETTTQVFSCCEIFSNISFEEDLRAAVSELAWRNDCLELCFWTVGFKTILTQW